MMPEDQKFSTESIEHIVESKRKKIRQTLKKYNRYNWLVFIGIFAILGAGFIAYTYAQKPEKVIIKGARGEVAIDILGSRLPAVAAAHNMAPQQLEKLFREDPTLEVDGDYNLLYVEPGMSEVEKKVIDKNVKAAKKAAEAQKKIDLANDGAGGSEVAGAVAPTEAFNLSSNLNSTLTIFLDFDGHVTSGTPWNTSFGTTIISAPWDLDGNASTYSDSERIRIIDIWKSVSEDYSAFNVNVTTKDPGVDALRKASSSDAAYGVRVVISPTNWYDGGAGGVAYLNSFTAATDTPVWCFSGSLSSSTYKSLSECAAHEIGHSVGLRHDGFNNDAYYLGHGVWAPIMGVGYYRNVTQWSKGEYTGANNTQDDITTIISFLTVKGDDIGDDTSSAQVMTVSGSGYSETGLIGRTGDADVFSFTWAGGGISILGKTNADVSEMSTKPATDLDASMRLLNASGQQLAISDPAGALPTQINMDLPAGNYFVEMKGVGYLGPSTGYSDYGSLGSYVLTVNSSTGTTPTPPPSNSPPTAKLAANPMSGTAPLNVFFSSAGSSDPEGKALTYSWNFGNGSTSTAANPTVTYTNPGVYSVVLTVKDDVGLTAQATTSVTVKAVTQTMTIASVTMEKITSSKQKYALVTIQITDQNGQAISGATVTGSWSGVATGTSSAITGSDGKVVMRSKNIRKGGTLTFSVTNVTYTSTLLTYTWDGVTKSASVVF